MDHGNYLLFLLFGEIADDKMPSNENLNSMLLNYLCLYFLITYYPQIILQSKLLELDLIFSYLFNLLFIDL